jgi:hypothetical protein
LLILLAVGSVASGQCDPDGNNTSVDAVPIGLSETVSDWVCPDDPFDYYVFNISRDDVSGSINFDAPQTGTVFSIDGETTGSIYDRSTTDAVRSLTFTVNVGDLAPDTYYIRVSHWSAYTYDHEYAITMDLSAVSTSECVPDGNEEPSAASDIAFGDTVSDWVCDTDHLDIWHFTVASDEEGAGRIILTADPGELRLYVYDSTEAELYSGPTTDGRLEYELGTLESPLPSGEYYIGVLLPLARDDENSYTLRLLPYVGAVTFPGGALGVQRVHRPEEEGEEEEEEEGPARVLPLGGTALQVLRAPQVPWPSSRGNA